MAVRVPEADPSAVEERPGPAEPATLATLAFALLLFVVLIANGRPAVAETPPLPAVLRGWLPSDETGAALAGKILASLFAALAGAVLFVALARRWAENTAVAGASLLVLATPVWGASQALWPQAPALLFVSLAVLFVLRAEFQPAWAGWAGLPLGLAVAVNPLDAPLAAVLAGAIIGRWPRRALSFLILGAAPVVVGLVARGAVLSAVPAEGLAARLGFAAPLGAGTAALLVSPGNGLVVFAPVVLVALAGMALSFRYGERWLAASFALAAAAHAVSAGSARDWAAADAWGPRLMVDAMPLLMLFLPDGLSRIHGVGWMLAAASIAIQALGAFAYDDGWVRRWPPAADHAELWDPEHGPIVEYARRRTLILAAPGLEAGRVVLRTHPVAPFTPRGSRVEFAGEALSVHGAEPTLRDAHALAGGRVEGGRLRLRSAGDGLFVRVAEGARARPLELRVAGRGDGAIQVGEGGFWNVSARSRRHAATGSFLIRHSYHYPESGGPDLRITLAPGSAPLELESVALVSPADPVDPLRRR